MIKIQKSIPIKASADEVWAIVGDLTRAPEFTPTIVSAHVDGLKRFCKDEGGNEIHEEMSNYSSELRQYAWRHVKSPLPVKSSEGWYFVKPDGKASIFEMVWEVDFLDTALETQLAPNLEGAVQMTLENLRHLAEKAS